METFVTKRITQFVFSFLSLVNANWQPGNLGYFNIGVYGIAKDRFKALNNG